MARKHRVADFDVSVTADVNLEGSSRRGSALGPLDVAATRTEPVEGNAEDGQVIVHPTYGKLKGVDDFLRAGHSVDELSVLEREVPNQLEAGWPFDGRSPGPISSSAT